MLKKIFLSTLLTIGLVASSLAMSGKMALAAGTGTSDATGQFTVSVGGNDVTIQASTGVYMTITTDDDTNTTSANVSAVHAKGEKMIGMDSDGGPLYYISTATGTTSPTSVAAVTGSDDFTAAWSPL